jgi:hypothetical protein
MRCPRLHELACYNNAFPGLISLPHFWAGHGHLAAINRPLDHLTVTSHVPCLSLGGFLRPTKDWCHIILAAPVDFSIRKSPPSDCI